MSQYHLTKQEEWDNASVETRKKWLKGHMPQPEWATLIERMSQTAYGALTKLQREAVDELF